MDNSKIDEIIGNQVSYIIKLIDEDKTSEAMACIEILQEFWELCVFFIGYSKSGRCLYDELKHLIADLTEESKNQSL